MPANVRQRYLNAIVDECLKLYRGDKEKAFARATKEEKSCCERGKTRTVYLNVVVNCVKKLRNEVVDSSKNPTPSTSGVTSGIIGLEKVTKSNLIHTHLDVLAGKGGAAGSWSIEKKVKYDVNKISADVMYAVLKRYALTEEQLADNGYPLADPDGPKGKAVIKEDPTRPRKLQPTAANLRNCNRCLKEYLVNKHGQQIEKEDCIYHWGRLYKGAGNRALGGPVQQWSCCKGEANADGCQVHDKHVADCIDYDDLRGFVETLEPSSRPANGDFGVFALDCEMCNTVRGIELTRVTVVDLKGKSVYESLVMPDNEIIDYNTRFSGIVADDLKDVKTKIRDVQAVLLSMFSSKTILIGHSLESDLKALKMLHKTVVDTSVVFPHKMGLPYKRALRSLSADYLKRIIQNDVGGHDSAEDALACLDLMKMKVKEDVEKMHKIAKRAV